MPEPVAVDCGDDDSAEDRPPDRADVPARSRRGQMWASPVAPVRRHRPWRSAAALLTLAAFLVAVSVGTYFLWRVDPNVVLENRLIEWMQAALLALAALVHAVRSRGLQDAVLRLSRVGLALFCTSLVLRELDLDKFGTNPAWQFAEVALRGVIITAWAIFAWPVVRSAAGILARLHRLARSPCAALTVCGGVFYLLSWPLDQFQPDLGALSAMFLEETLQLNGTILFFVAAWTALDR